MESFFAGACTWQKILLSLQVWNLFAFSEQIMRAADCKPFVKKGLCSFLTVSYYGYLTSAPAELSFEDKLKQFMSVSDSKQSELNRYMASKRGGRRRK